MRDFRFSHFGGPCCIHFQSGAHGGSMTLRNFGALAHHYMES